ncbi:hypothetical protein QZH41_018410 [Actinostola sp. cb2023]|nr:hypothetical protein QZH41_018410 [Actinostola sp. cb2023]
MYDVRWLKKALQRSKEQAEEEGCSLEDVVCDRWGSLERLETLIVEAEKEYVFHHFLCPFLRDSERKHTNDARDRDRSYDKGKSWRRNSGRERYRKDDKDRGRERYSSRHKDDDTARRDYRDDDGRNKDKESEKDSKQSKDYDRSRHGRRSDRDASTESESKHFVQRDKREPRKSEKVEKRPDRGATNVFKRPENSDSLSSSLKFMKPYDESPTTVSASKPGQSSGGWRKKGAPGESMPRVNRIEQALKKRKEKSKEDEQESSSSESSDSEDDNTNSGGNKVLEGDSKSTDNQEAEPIKHTVPTKKITEADLNSMGAKILRAELMGNEVTTHGESGQRERYFADDDRYELNDIVRREKMNTAEDYNSMFARLASKGASKTDSDEFTLDDHFVSGAANKYSKAKEEERDKMKAIKEHQRLSAQLSKCRFCFENPDLAKHLIIAIGMQVYLAVPLHTSLTEGHCLIIPMQHQVAYTYIDEDVIDEIKVFKKGLTRMFQEMDKDVVFLETCRNLTRQNHMIIECIPVPKEDGDLAPMYFKKAILESDSEWAHNKKLIDTSKKGLRGSIPKGLPYFSVEFGLDGGFAHVVEEEHLFPNYFGKEIIGGMLDLEPWTWHKPHKQNFEQHKKKVLQFAEWWKPYDWTKKLAKNK